MRAREAAALLEEEPRRSREVVPQPHHTRVGSLGQGGITGERCVQEMGMEKRVLLVLFSQKSHTSCSESQKGSVVLALTHKQTGKDQEQNQNRLKCKAQE